MRFYEVRDDGTESGAVRVAVAGRGGDARKLRKEWANGKREGGVTVIERKPTGGKWGMLRELNALLGWPGGDVPTLYLGDTKPIKQPKKTVKSKKGKGR